MQTWEIWSEGYAATGERSDASLEGTVWAETFDEACIQLLGDKLDREKDGSFRRGSLRTLMQPGIARTEAILKGGNYSIWCCQLFPTEQEARKSFG
jgi:hypothetical protein